MATAAMIAEHDTKAQLRVPAMTLDLASRQTAAPDYRDQAATSLGRPLDSLIRAKLMPR